MPQAPFFGMKRGASAHGRRSFSCAVNYFTTPFLRITLAYSALSLVAMQA